MKLQATRCSQRGKLRVERRRRFPDSDATLRSQSCRFSTSTAVSHPPQKQGSFSNLISHPKDGARSRRLDRTAHPMQTTLRSRRKNSLRQGSYSHPRSSARKMVSSSPHFPLCFIVFHPLLLGERNLDGGVKCPARKVSGYCLWRHPWPICTFHPCSTADL